MTSWPDDIALVLYLVIISRYQPRKKKKEKKKKLSPISVYSSIKLCTSYISIAYYTEQLSACKLASFIALTLVPSFIALRSSTDTTISHLASRARTPLMFGDSLNSNVQHSHSVFYLVRSIAGPGKESIVTWGRESIVTWSLVI